MRSVVFCLILILCAGGAFAADCQKTQTVTVTAGHERSVERTALKVKFVGVVEDSRCPKDVECVWAGNAKIKVRVSRKGRSKIIELNTNTAGKDNVFAGYRIELAGLTPEARSDVRIAPGDYQARITVTRSK